MNWFKSLLNKQRVLVDSHEPIVLGINLGHDASIAIFNSNECLFSIAEERVTRIKHHYGFPIESIKTALKELEITGQDIDIIAISTQKPIFPNHRNHIIVDIYGNVTGPGQKEFMNWKPGLTGYPDANIGEPKSKSSFKGTSWEGFENRHWSYHEKELQQLGLMNLRIRYVYVAHHRAHAASAFRMSDFQDEHTCVVTLDGKGDGQSGTIYLGHPDGKMELKRSTPAIDSLGSFYQAVTEAIGFVPVDGEYKTMGLAAIGKSDLDNPFSDIMHVSDGSTNSSINWTFRPYNDIYPNKKVPNPLGSVSQTEIFAKYLKNHDPEQIAYFAQEVLENIVLDLIRDAMDITASSNLAVAGGVMLNVKANSKIRDELKPKKYFVFPDSADSGLALGAALEALHTCGFNVKSTLNSPYLGVEFQDHQVKESLSKYDDIYVEYIGDALPSRLADELVNGKVIGTFQGRMEMGPRALGNRSVLADPRNVNVKNRINLILKGREWFVPFAPIVLNDEANKYWEGSIDYKHMTFAVNATDYAKEHVPGVVHVDGTMRPQVVTHKRNAWLNSVLLEFRERTGVGVLINTSFNRHGLPIVGSPDDAIDHMRQGWVDCLAIGGYLVHNRKN